MPPEIRRLLPAGLGLLRIEAGDDGDLVRLGCAVDPIASPARVVGGLRQPADSSIYSASSSSPLPGLARKEMKATGFSAHSL